MDPLVIFLNTHTGVLVAIGAHALEKGALLSRSRDYLGV